jgi:cytochrome c oxidase subunit III
LTITGKLQSRSPVMRTIGIYWHFVDAVWIFVFTTIYLLPSIL